MQIISGSSHIPTIPMLHSGPPKVHTVDSKMLHDLTILQYRNSQDLQKSLRPSACPVIAGEDIDMVEHFGEASPTVFEAHEAPRVVDLEKFPSLKKNIPRVSISFSMFFSI